MILVIVLIGLTVLGGFLFSRGGALWISLASLSWLLVGVLVLASIIHVPLHKLRVMEGRHHWRLLGPGWHWSPFGLEWSGLLLSTQQWEIPLLEGSSLLLRDGSVLRATARLWVRLQGAPDNWAQMHPAVGHLRQLGAADEESLKERIKNLCLGDFLNAFQSLSLPEVSQQSRQAWLNLFQPLRAWGLEPANFALETTAPEQVITGAVEGEARARDLGRGLRRTAEEMRHRRLGWDQAFRWARQLTPRKRR